MAKKNQNQENRQSIANQALNKSNKSQPKSSKFASEIVKPPKKLTPCVVSADKAIHS